MTQKILVCDLIHLDGLKMLKEAGFEVEENSNLTPPQLEKHISGFDAVIVRGRTKITETIINSAQKLSVIARSGVGLDNINVDAARKRNIKVVSTPAAPTSAVAELAINLMLSVLRKVAYADKAMKDGRWLKNELMGSELKAKTVGVLGAAGRIGLEVARIAIEGFRAKAIGHDVIDFTDKARAIGLRNAAGLNNLLAEADIVTIHVPYLQTTHHLINEDALNHMKNSSILINTSRGDIIDGQALLYALKSGKIAGAGLDVFHQEPPTDEWEKELVQLPNTVCTSHIGAQTVECQRLQSIEVAQELIRLFTKNG